MVTGITSAEQLKKFTSENKGALLYFSTPDCNVCKVLKPKLYELIASKYPGIEFGYVDISTLKEIAGELAIFSVPTVIVYFDGREFFRKSRNLSLEEFSSEIDRPYTLLYENSTN